MLVVEYAQKAILQGSQCGSTLETDFLPALQPQGRSIRSRIVHMDPRYHHHEDLAADVLEGSFCFALFFHLKNQRRVRPGSDVSGPPRLLENLGISWKVLVGKVWPQYPFQDLVEYPIPSLSSPLSPLTVHWP